VLDDELDVVGADVVVVEGTEVLEVVTAAVVVVFALFFAEWPPQADMSPAATITATAGPKNSPRRRRRRTVTVPCNSPAPLWC